MCAIIGNTWFLVSLRWRGKYSSAYLLLANLTLAGDIIEALTSWGAIQYNPKNWPKNCPEKCPEYFNCSNSYFLNLLTLIFEEFFETLLGTVFGTVFGTVLNRTPEP